MIYEVGKYYEVPQAFGRWKYNRGGLRWWTVYDSPLHEDKKHLNFPPWHLHIDARFLPKRYHEVEGGIDCTFRWPLQWFFDPETRCELFRSDASRGSTDLMGRDLTPEQLQSLLRKCTRRRKVRCLQEVPRFPHHVLEQGANEQRNASAGFVRLHEELHGREAPNGICPHKGANLSSIPMDRDGLTTCPLHGARVRCTYG